MLHYFSNAICYNSCKNCACFNVKSTELQVITLMVDVQGHHKSPGAYDEPDRIDDGRRKLSCQHLKSFF